MASTTTPIGWLYYPALYVAKGNKQVPSQPLRFSSMLLLDAAAVASTAYANLKQAVFDAIVGKFGAQKANDKAFVGTLRLPFRAAAEKDYGGFTDGEVFISAWSPADQQPGVVDLQGQKILVPADVFPGQLARFTVRPFAYDTSGNKGVGLILEHVQIVKADMPRRDGNVAAEDAFKGADDSQMAALGINSNAVAGGTAYNTPAAGSLPF